MISPMRYGADAVDVVYECIKHNIPISCITAAQAGATAPAPIALAFVQAMAECLAGGVYVNAIKKGAPAIFGT